MIFCLCKSGLYSTTSIYAEKIGTIYQLMMFHFLKNTLSLELKSIHRAFSNPWNPGFEPQGCHTETRLIIDLFMLHPS